MTSMPPPTPPAAPSKKTSPWVWLGLGCAAIIVVGLVAVAVLTFWVGHKVKSYSDLAQKNPAMAAAKLAVAANPDAEVVSEDDSAGTITVRNKKTGETITMDTSDIKNGRLRFKNEKGEETTFEGKGAGGKGSFKVKSNRGEMTFGAGSEASVPDWVPSYPGATAAGTYSSKSDEGIAGGYSFQTADSPDEVMAYFESRLKGDGYDVNRSNFEHNGKTSGGIVQGTANGGARTVQMTVSATDGGGTSVAVVYSEKSNS